MDEIERKIRAARPLSGNRHMPAPEWSETELQKILSDDLPDAGAGNREEEPTTAGRGKKRARTLVLAAMTLALVVALSFQLAPGAPQQAQATTPEMLELQPIEGDAAQWLHQLSQAAAQREEPSVETSTVESESWSLNIEIDDNGEVQFHDVVPHRSTYTHHPDGSVSMEVRAGEPFTEDYPDGEMGDLPEEGSILVDEVLPPGELDPLYSEPFPTEPSEIDDYFAEAIGDTSALTGYETLNELAILFSEQTPDPQAEAALLAHLATLPDVTLAGETTDRLDRDGIAFTAEDPEGEHKMMLIVSREGQILSTELQYIGTSREYLDAPSVIDYSAWKRNPTE